MFKKHEQKQYVKDVKFSKDENNETLMTMTFQPKHDTHIDENFWRDKSDQELFDYLNTPLQLQKRNEFGFKNKILNPVNAILLLVLVSLIASQIMFFNPDHLIFSVKDYWMFVSIFGVIVLVDLILSISHDYKRIAGHEADTKAYVELLLYERSYDNNIKLFLDENQNKEN